MAKDTDNFSWAADILGPASITLVDCTQIVQL
jgi:hypothetical protein